MPVSPLELIKEQTLASICSEQSILKLTKEWNTCDIVKLLAC